MVDVSGLGLHTIDSVNSTVADSDEWDSGWHLGEMYRRIKFSMYSDKSLRIGLKWSNNGSDVMAQADSVSSTAGEGEGGDYANYDKYCKLVIINESGSDAILRAAILGEI